nr:DUF222 domain-containing protein [Mycobacterium uberis]
MQTFLRDLPDATPTNAVAHTEQFLTQQAVKLRTDQLEKMMYGHTMLMNLSGRFSDSDCACKRSFTWV